MSNVLRWACLLALVVIVGAMYALGLNGGFAFDDYPNIVDNVALHVQSGAGSQVWLAAVFSSPSNDLQRPLAMASFALNHALAGLDPWSMKLTNIGIHLLNTCLVYGLTRRLLRLPRLRSDSRSRDEWTALWVAAAWALNPINLMAVLLIVQRMESLSHTFVFAGLWLYTAARVRQLEGRGGWAPLVIGPVACTLLGSGVKESALLLPVYALALEGFVFDFATWARTRDRRLLVGFAALVVLPVLLAFGWLLPRVLQPAAWSNRDFGLIERLLTEPRVLVDYLHWTILPNLSQLSLYHDDYVASRGLLSPPSTLAAMLLVASIAALALWLRSRRPLMALGLAWFLIAHALTATIVPLELVFEHRNYFASFGLMLAIADLLRMLRFGSARSVGAWTACALLILYGASTAARAFEWRDPLQFAVTEAAKHPRSPRATYSLARTLVMLTRYEPGSPYAGPARAALENAMKAPGATVLPEAAAILFAARSSQPIDPRWWRTLEEKLRQRPIGSQETSALAALVDCAIRHACPPSFAEMRASFAAAEHNGESAEVLNIAGNYALNVERNPAAALRLWKRAAELSPTTVEYQATMARMLIASGRPHEAEAYIQRIRGLGRLGQHDVLARQLQAQAMRAATPHAPGE